MWCELKKHDLPAMMWYWGDWFKASDVQALPRDVRCTWFEMIGRMHESKEYGYLLLNGKAPTDEMLAQMLGYGSNTDLLNQHLNLMDNYGVYSRREQDGAIYCRRMLHDAKVREERRKSGRKGGNPKLLDNRSVKQKDNQKVNQIPEDESESENESVNGIEIHLRVREERDSMKAAGLCGKLDYDKEHDEWLICRQNASHAGACDWETVEPNGGTE